MFSSDTNLSLELDSHETSDKMSLLQHRLWYGNTHTNCPKVHRKELFKDKPNVTPFPYKW